MRFSAVFSVLFFLVTVINIPSGVLAQESGAILSEGYTRLVAPELLLNLVHISADNDINFALRPDGSVVCWGEDPLYLNDIVNPASHYLDVSVGALHVMLLQDDGSIVTYGGPDYWFDITPVAPNSGYTAISAGYILSLALRAGGSVESWGIGGLVVPEPNEEFTAIAAGGATAYALRANGSIAVWGQNNYGQYDVPEPNSGFVSISAGEYFAMALREDGSIAVWGRDNCSQHSIPAPNSGFISIAAGHCHALGLREGGVVEAWGDNSQGQTVVPTLNSGFTKISAGSHHSLAVDENGQLVAWGRRDDGACGVYPPNEDFTAVDNDLALRSDGSLWLYLQGQAPADIPGPNSGFVEMERRGNFTLALRDDGSIVGWGQNYKGQLDVPLPNSGYNTFSTGNDFSIALRDDRSIEVWGDNWHGQMNIPEPDAEYIAVAAGSHHNSALKSDGSVSVWGYLNEEPPPSETGYTAIAAGQYHTLALHEDGYLAAWGTWAPALLMPEPNEGFVAIHADEKTNVAMRADGTLVAWGASIWDSAPLFSGSDDIASFEVFSSSIFAVESPPVSAVDQIVPQSSDNLLLGAMPNPFNPTLSIWFEFPLDQSATMGVFDVKGRRVRALWSGALRAGQRKTISWDGRDDTGSRVSSGTYLVHIEGTRSGVRTRTVSLVK